MAFESWRDLYQHDLQALYTPLVVPLVFLLYRAVTPARRGGVVPQAASFVVGYAMLFAVETILDPIATGPLVRALGIADGWAGTALLLTFVLLGDFRVFLLVFALTALARISHQLPAAIADRHASQGVLALRSSTYRRGMPASLIAAGALICTPLSDFASALGEKCGLAAGQSWRGQVGRAAAWTLIVPAAAYSIFHTIDALAAELPSSAIWLVYELGFFAMALYLRTRWVPRHVPVADSGLRAYLRAATAYVAVYYALWAIADILIQVFGLDFGWALRVLPNQLYYGFWVPFVFFRFFAPRYHSTSASAHASR